MKHSIRLVLVLTLVCLICAFLVSAADYITKEPIRIAKQHQEKAAYLAVLPAGASEPVSCEVVVENEDDSVTTNQYWKTDKGYAMKMIAPNGYSGKIEMVLGFTLDGNFWSYQVLSHTETPGLGSHITGSFIENVKNRSASKTNWKVTKDGGDIKPITAATISSRAVCGVIARAAKIYEAIQTKEAN